jgi:hypothetical protein
MHYSTFMDTTFYIAPTCFDIIVSLSSGSWHQNFFKTYSNKLAPNKFTYVVVSMVQNYTGFNLKKIYKYNIMLAK